MKTLLKDEYNAYLESFNNKAYKGLRVNTNKITVEDFQKIFPFKLERIPWTSDGFYYFDEEVSKHLFYHLGLYYLQEPSAMLPAEVLPINENDIVLDACAAPGGKSLKLLNKLNDTGILLSNDISASRAKALLRNIEKQGFKRYFVSAEDTKKLEDKYTNTFDAILLDAPCSGEGMFRKEPSLINSWIERGNDYYANIQKELIVSCIKMLKNGGRLVYSTCTFDESEDEDVISYALSQFENVKVLPIKMCDGFKIGKNNIGVKLFPHKVKGEGHFVCLLQKGNEEIRNNVLNTIEIDINENKYIVPDFDTKGIRLLRSGLLLGTNKKNNFEYSQSYAVSLKVNEFSQTIELNEENALRYLKGETIKVNSNLKGLVLLTYYSFPLGFGKIDNGIVKNKIDKGWTIK